MNTLIIWVATKMQFPSTSYEAGLINDTHPSIASANGHVSSEDSPGVGLRAVHLNTGQVAGPVITANHVENSVVSDNPCVPSAVIHIRHRTPLVCVRVVALDT